MNSNKNMTISSITDHSKFSEATLKRPADSIRQMGDSLTTLDITDHSSSRSLDCIYESRDQDITRYQSESEEFEFDHQVSAEKLRAMKVEGREVRRRKLEAARKTTMPEITRRANEKQRIEQATFLRALAVNQCSNGTHAWLREDAKSSGDSWYVRA
jgi:hypothetical protein